MYQLLLLGEGTTEENRVEEQVQQEEEVDDLTDNEDRVGLAFGQQWGRVGHQAQVLLKCHG